jgi:hypothetical protein
MFREVRVQLMILCAASPAVLAGSRARTRQHRGQDVRQALRLSGMQRRQAWEYELMPNGSNSARHAPLRRLVPVRLQQDAGVAERVLRVTSSEVGMSAKGHNFMSNNFIAYYAIMLLLMESW